MLFFFFTFNSITKLFHSSYIDAEIHSNADGESTFFVCFSFLFYFANVQMGSNELHDQNLAASSINFLWR